MASHHLLTSRAVGVVAGVVLALGTTTVPASAATSAAGGSVHATASQARQAKPSKVERAVVSRTNAERRRAGLRSLSTGRCVQRFADRWAHSMAKRRVMEHQDIGRVLRACKLSRVGENVAYGQPGAASVVSAWMHSPGHRANILSAPYRTIGVGVARGSDGRRYYAQVFGTPR